MESRRPPAGGRALRYFGHQVDTGPDLPAVWNPRQVPGGMPAHLQHRAAFPPKGALHIQVPDAKGCPFGNGWRHIGFVPKGAEYFLEHPWVALGSPAHHDAAAACLVQAGKGVFPIFNVPVPDHGDGKGSGRFSDEVPVRGPGVKLLPGPGVQSPRLRLLAIRHSSGHEPPSQPARSLPTREGTARTTFR